ncbi:unnamed protein product [Choristocarpus tenellus]
MRSRGLCGVVSSLLLAGGRAFHTSSSHSRLTQAKLLISAGARKGISYTSRRASMSAESQEKKATGHQPSTGHGSVGGVQRTPEEEALSARIQAHQEGAARLTKTEGEIAKLSSFL